MMARNRMLVDTVLRIRDQINREKMLCNNSLDGLTFRSHLWNSSNVPFHAMPTRFMKVSQGGQAGLLSRE